MTYLIGSYHFKAVKYFLILVLKLKSLATTSRYNSKDLSVLYEESILFCSMQQRRIFDVLIVENWMCC